MNMISKIPAKAKPLVVKLQKHAPDIMTVLGVGMTVGGAVWACKRTIKARDILEKAAEDFASVEEALEVAQSYDEQDARADRRTIYVKTAAELVKTYGGPVLVGISGLSLVLGAHKIMGDRNSALTAAYSNLLASYTAYREKVSNTIGAEKELQLRSGYSKQDVSYIDENDKEKKVKNAKVIDTGENHSIYARVFDESCPEWSRNPAANLTFLRQSQNYANDKLRSEGVLFLNDVYQMLGFPRTSEGQIVGWVWDPDNSEVDSYVDFGIYEMIYKSEAKRDFINAYEPCIWLDFNVDGVVYDLL